MSFMPAEEFDDYDEDGFIYSSDFIEVSSTPFEDVKAPILTPSQNGSFSGSNSGYDRGKSNGGYKESVDESGRPRFAPPSHISQRHKSSVMVSAEDMRMGIMKNNREVVERYIDLGLPIDEPLRSGWTTLMYAAHYARPDFVQLLLKHGADVKCHCDMFTALMCASLAVSSDVAMVTECVDILIKAGADVNAKDRFHSTSLMLACREGRLPVVKLLLGAGAKVNAQDNQGWTALTRATQHSQAAVIVELMNNGANPDIEHADKLTVRDMAAHLPSDDMLALLERRPVKTSSSLVVKSVAHQGQGDAATANSHSTDDLQLETQARLTDWRYGELEVFLLGLDLAFLVPVLQEQMIDLQLLMTLTEQDLINAGITQVGARKKILDAVQAVHKKDWQASSLVSIHFNKRISCADAVAMLANSSRHLRYVCSTAIYVREQLKKHPETIMLPTDRVSPGQLLRHTEDAITNAEALAQQVASLKLDLEAEMFQRNIQPPDLIGPDITSSSTIAPNRTNGSSKHSYSSPTSRRGLHRPNWRISVGVCGASALLASLAVVAWLGRDSLGAVKVTVADWLTRVKID